MKKQLLTLFSIAALAACTPSETPKQEVSGEYYDWTVTMKPERPYVCDYNKTIVSKLFLCDAKENKPEVYQTFEQALETIKKYDAATVGIPKIVYLVGWQYTGHDTGYPSWSVVNELLKRPEDATALESLRWLINEGRKYNTTVSLHINMFDAFMNSPVWKEYCDNDVIVKDKQGNPIKGEVFGGGQSYQISYAQEWEKGFAQRRIDSLLTMIPELVDGGTIHVDAYHTYTPNDVYIQKTPVEQITSISPYLGISIEDETAAQRKIFRYWRDKGLDVTSEGFLFLRVDPFIGLQPLTWNFNESELDGNWKYKPTNFKRLGSELCSWTPLRLEQEIKADPNNYEPIIDQFVWRVVPWYFTRNAYSSQFTDVLISDDEIFCPMAWQDKMAMAASKKGFTNRTFRLPTIWGGMEKVKLCKITTEGLQEIGTADVKGGKITITTKPGDAIVIVG